jgi:hypothetical protein
MTRILCTTRQRLALPLLIFIAAAAYGQEDFTKSKMIVVEGNREKLAAVVLQFGKDSIVATGKKSGRAVLDVPYGKISAISYETAKRHRVNEGAGLAAVSLGGGLILMTTKTESYWLAIDYENGQSKQRAVIQLHKDEVDDALRVCRAKCGKAVEVLAADQHRVNVTAGSRNIDVTVAYPREQVVAALKGALERYSCAITAEKSDRIECKRHKTGYNEITGIGGERVAARFSSRGEATRLRISTEKGMSGKFAKKNWSTPIYQELMQRLNPAAAVSGNGGH